MDALKDEKRLAALDATGLTNEADAALDRFAQLVRRVLDVPVALVSLVDSERQFFPGATGLCEPYGTDRQTPLSHSVCRSVVASGQAIVEADIRLVDGLRDSLAIPDLDVVAYAGVPMADEAGHVLGSLCAIDGTPRRWSAADVENLTDLAAACASELRLRIAARAARAAGEQAERSVARVELIADAAHAVAATEDVATALPTLLDLLVPRLADWAYVLLSDGTRPRHLAHLHRHGHDELMARFATTLARSMSPDSPTYRVLSGAGPQLLSPLDQTTVARMSADESMTELVRELGAESFIAVPLTARGRLLGVIGLVRGPGVPVFDESDLRVAVDLASRAGAALDNAQVSAQQRHVAEVLQTSLLAPLPTLPGLEISAVYRPSVHGEQVGGDWYDAFQSADGVTTLVIGDVMGHDIAAAAAMGHLRSVVRTIAYERSENPAHLLSRIDAAIEGLGLHVMATCVIVRLQRAASGAWRVSWSNAGHPPPALAVAGRPPEILHSTPNLMLGVDADAPRQYQETVLAGGSALVLYTDGLVEHRALDIDAGLSRLTAALEAGDLSSVHDLSRALADVVAADPDADDDVAVLVVSPSVTIQLVDHELGERRTSI